MTDKKLRILIAEDEKPMANALGLKLQKEGFDTVVAYNGGQAIDLISKDGIDLILLDIMMPEKDGYEVLEFMQKEGINTPVIISSNLGQKEDFDKAKTLGADDYFIKSDTPINEVVEHITKLLGNAKK